MSKQMLLIRVAPVFAYQQALVSLKSRDPKKKRRCLDMLLARPLQRILVRLASLREQAGAIPASVYEPTFEDPREFPEYDAVNVRLQGYDFVPLENFQGFVHRIAKRFNFSVLDSYAVAAKTEKVVTYKAGSTIPDSEIDLSFYERVVRLEAVPGPRLQLYSNIIKAHTPIGVKVTVKLHEKEDEDSRYIPDVLLKEKQAELKALDDPTVRRNLGWE